MAEDLWSITNCRRIKQRKMANEEVERQSNEPGEKTSLKRVRRSSINSGRPNCEYS